MRRAFFLCLTLGLGLAIYAILIEPRQIKVRQMDIGGGSQSLRLVVASDLHIGNLHGSVAQMDRLVSLINEQAADYVLMPGDFIGGHEPRSALEGDEVTVIKQGLTALAALNAPVFASLGNHDSWHDAAYVYRSLEMLGVSVLDNEAVQRGDLCFVGLADHDTSTPDAAAFNACEAGTVIIALMHSPDSRSLIRSDTALTVAGHTHGGQVNLPFIGRKVTATACGEPCAYGLIQSEPPILVTSGVGTSLLPVRFRAPPEIVVVTLRY